MEFKHTLEATMEARFDNRGEMEDIMNHGIAAGFSGFTYTHEIEAFFNEFENELEDYFYDNFGSRWMIDFISERDDITSVSELKQFMVFSYVECWCVNKVEDEDYVAA